MSDKLLPKEAIEVIDFRVSPTSWQTAGSVSQIITIAIAVLLIIWILWIVLWLNVLTKKFSGLLQILVNQEEIINGYQDGMRWIKPTCKKIEILPDETDAEETSKNKIQKIVFWVRAKSEESVEVYAGGWLSVLTMGLLAKKSLVTKGDGITDLGEYIRISVEN